MKAEALLRRVAEPSRDEIARALAGNLCRCTGYVKVIDAIESVAPSAAARRCRPRRPRRAAGDGVGEPAGRYEGAALVLGEHPFVADMTVPGMLHGAVRFADHPRAVVRRIDTSRAAAHPGVLAVVTWRDVPGRACPGPARRGTGRCSSPRARRPATSATSLAAVAATTRHAAREAAALIEVDYDVLEPVTDPVAALAPGRAAVHPRRQPPVDAASSAAATSTRRSPAPRTS